MQMRAMQEAGGTKMMKVWVLWSASEIFVFSSYKKAKAYLKQEGYKPECARSSFYLQEDGEVEFGLSLSQAIVR